MRGYGRGRLVRVRVDELVATSQPASQRPSAAPRTSPGPSGDVHLWLLQSRSAVCPAVRSTAPDRSRDVPRAPHRAEHDIWVPPLREAVRDAVVLACAATRSGSTLVTS